MACMNGVNDRVVLSLLNHAPEFATVKDRKTGLLPIQVATEINHTPLRVHVLLKKYAHYENLKHGDVERIWMMRRQCRVIRVCDRSTRLMRSCSRFIERKGSR